MPDRELLAAIRREIAESPFVGEGHKKICARLRIRGIHTSRKRVLRLTRGAGPDAILNKPGPSTTASGIMRRHSEIGERIVAAAPALG